jgi:hypothetical protein
MAISLATVVTDYLTAVTTSLTVGPDLGSSIRGAASNYLRAQDMATVLDLLQEVIGSTGHTASGGSATTVVDAAMTTPYVVSEQIGNVVVFGAATTTVALRGVESRITANSATVLTVGTLPAVCASGDVYSIRGGVADTAITSLRQGGGRADAPSGSVYGSHMQAYSGMENIIVGVGGTTPTARVPLQILVHPGAQPGENIVLADFIDQLQTLVEATTVPA